MKNNLNEASSLISTTHNLYNIYNRYGLTDYHHKWMIHNDHIIYASRHSVVYYCSRIKSSLRCCQLCLDKKEYVVKVASISINEIYCLKQLSHPNICPLVDCYQNLYGMLLIFPFYPEGDLMDVLKKHTLKNMDKVNIVTTLIDVLHYLHDHEVAHGDIKIENILMRRVKYKKGYKWQILLSDFGLAVVKGKTDVVIDNNIDLDYYAMDVWNLGIIILYLYGCTIDQQLNSKSSQLKITSPILVDVSLTSNSSIDTDDETLLMEENIFQSLLPHILERDPAKRWNISQCYKWVTEHASPNRLPSDKSKR